MEIYTDKDVYLGPVDIEFSSEEENIKIRDCIMKQEDSAMSGSFTFEVGGNAHKKLLAIHYSKMSICKIIKSRLYLLFSGK